MFLKNAGNFVRNFYRALAFLSVLFAMPLMAAGREWPSGPIHMVVGFPGGSAADLHARVVAEPLARVLRQPVIVENRVGASGNIGANAVAKATDGLTIGTLASGSLTSSSFLYEKLPYDSSKDFAPIAVIASAPLVWVTTPRFSNMSNKFVAEARKMGGNLFYGSIGAGSGSHLAMELINQAFGLRATHVPFNGGPAVLNALLGGQIQMALLSASTVMPMIEAGKLVGVGVTSAKRSALVPQLPSMQELGASDVDIEVWNAVMAPASMPTEHLNLLRTEIGRILQTPEVVSKLTKMGWVAGNADPGSIAARIEKEKKMFGEIIRKNNIKTD